MSDFVYMLVVGGLTAGVLLSFGLVIFFFLRENRLRSMAPTHAQTDLTNMMILFQTMRDILAQQKDLAREFNISIDQKVGEVRSLINSTGDVRKELERAKREIFALSTRTRKELAVLERRLMEVNGGIARGTSEEGVTEALDEAAELDHTQESDTPEPVSDEASEETADPPESAAVATSALDVPAPQEETEEGLIDQWTGFEGDEDGDEIDEEDLEPEMSPEEAEQEAAQTRDAFRTLLNLEPQGDGNGGGTSSTDVLNPGGNGGQYLTPIQKRVYEYSDAGMRVPEIARELGVGKGEVRLILSLRQGQGH